MADLGGPGPAAPPLALSQTFAPVSTAAWQAQVRRELDGRDPQQLLWHTDEGVDVQPFPRRQDLDGLGLEAAGVPGAAPFTRGTGNTWQRLEAPAWPADAVRADRLHDAGATAVQELAFAMAEGVERLLAAASGGTPPAATGADIEFVFAVGSTFFVEIAKLRAARVLWASVLHAFAVADQPMRLHVRTARANKSLIDPGTNLLRVTTEAMSAAIGGADTLLVEPHGFEPHLAVNVQHLLADEAHLGAVADPAAGSYCIELLTDALAREGWALFQQVEAAGGFAACVASGERDRQVQASARARQEAVASRRRTLVGVNDYPDLTAHAPLPEPSADDDPESPPPLQLSAPFEALRRRTARHVAATGRVPVVHLLTRGDVRMRMARANFSLNLFGCAGFAITRGESLPVDADLIVLCGADDDYPAMAREVVPQVTVPVVVAGRPGALTGMLLASGIAGVVHAGSDAVETLTQLQDRLGLAP